MGRQMVIATAILLGLLNLAIGLFYALWSIADDGAAARTELHGFDPSQLLPNDGLFWLTANVSIALLVTVDVFVILLLVRLARQGSIETRRVDAHAG